MRRQSASYLPAGGPSAGGPAGLPPRSGLWAQLIRPALVIALIGTLAVVYLWACARLSVMDCDKRRLQRIAADDEARRAELRTEAAARRSADRILAHAGDRGLKKPRALVHVTVDEVPESLWAEMPRDGSPPPDEGVRLGQLAPGSSAAPAPPPPGLH